MTRTCKRIPKRAQCPDEVPNIKIGASQRQAGKERTNLQRHEERLSLDVGKAEVNASRVAVRVAVSLDVLDLRRNAVQESIRQRGDTGVVELKEVKQGMKSANVLRSGHGKSASWGSVSTPTGRPQRGRTARTLSPEKGEPS